MIQNWLKTYFHQWSRHIMSLSSVSVWNYEYTSKLNAIYGHKYEYISSTSRDLPRLAFKSQKIAKSGKFSSIFLLCPSLPPQFTRFYATPSILCNGFWFTAVGESHWFPSYETFYESTIAWFMDVEAECRRRTNGLKSYEIDAVVLMNETAFQWARERAHELADKQMI